MSRGGQKRGFLPQPSQVLVISEPSLVSLGLHGTFSHSGWVPETSNSKLNSNPH